MSIAIAILYGVAVVTAAFAAVFSGGAFGAAMDPKLAPTGAEKVQFFAISFVCGSITLSITFWLAGV